MILRFGFMRKECRNFETMHCNTFSRNAILIYLHYTLMSHLLRDEVRGNLYM